MTEEFHQHWISRYFSFWMIPAIAFAESDRRRDVGLEALGRRVTANTVFDMKCNPPDRIIIERRPRNFKLQETRFDFQEFFRRNADFDEIFKHYRLTDRSYFYDTYQLARPYGDVGAPGCRRIF